METPEPILWDASWMTGQAEIDEQHRFLVGILNDAIAETSGAARRNRIDDLLRDLLGYALSHFETEENLMQRSGYARAFPAETAAHVQQHRSFSERIVAFRDSLRSQEGDEDARLVTYLAGWLADHILKTDRQLARYLQG